MIPQKIGSKKALFKSSADFIILFKYNMNQTENRRQFEKKTFFLAKRKLNKQGRAGSRKS
jgi:hypothetical protein